MLKILRRLFVAVSFMAVVAACGGAADGGTGAPSDPTWPPLVAPQEHGRLAVDRVTDAGSAEPCWTVSLDGSVVDEFCPGRGSMVSAIASAAEFGGARVTEAFGAPVSVLLLYVGPDAGVGYIEDVDLSHTYIAAAPEVVLLYSIGSSTARSADFAITSRGVPVLWCTNGIVVNCAPSPPPAAP